VSKYERYMNIDEIITDIESISQTNRTPLYIAAAAAVLVTAGIITAFAVSSGGDNPATEKSAEIVSDEHGKSDEVKQSDDSDGLNIKFGDINNDGKIDTSDASQLLSVYSIASTSGRKLSDVEMAVYDINSDGVVNSSDAGFILEYYSLKSTNKVDSFKDFINEQNK
ncbi:MAG: hypothetical protein J6I55_08415, partial [Ruminococcus sp.]|nr:hypothetical protein [Ruminococcus sp.]